MKHLSAQNERLEHCDEQSEQELGIKGHIFTAIKASGAVFVGYLVMGIAWGILAATTPLAPLAEAATTSLAASPQGFSLAQTLLAAAFVFSGSLQFLLVAMLAAGTPLLEIALASALLNSRYFFYATCSAPQFATLAAPLRAACFYLINDESFALISARKFAPLTVFFILFFCYSYWIFGCALGWLGAALLQGDFSALGFSLNALFIVLSYELAIKCRRKILVIAALALAGASWLIAPERLMLLCAVGLNFCALLALKKVNKI